MEKHELAEIRKHLGKTQKQLAQLLGISSQIFLSSGTRSARRENAGISSIFRILATPLKPD